MPLLRVNDKWKHYLKEIELEIDLPKPSFENYEKVSSDLGIDIYIGYENDSLLIKTYGGIKLLNLEKIKSLVYSVKSSKTKKELDNIYFSLVADKRVSNKKIDSIKTILKEFPEIKIFRVYWKEFANYGDYPLTREDQMWDWYGKYE